MKPCLLALLLTACAPAPHPPPPTPRYTLATVGDGRLQLAIKLDTHTGDTWTLSQDLPYWHHLDSTNTTPPK